MRLILRLKRSESVINVLNLSLNLIPRFVYASYNVTPSLCFGLSSTLMIELYPLPLRFGNLCVTYLWTSTYRHERHFNERVDRGAVPFKLLLRMMIMLWYYSDWIRGIRRCRTLVGHDTLNTAYSKRSRLGVIACRIDKLLSIRMGFSI